MPVGVGNGAVVLSKGRVVGGINVTSVTFPVGTESVTLVVAVTTRVDPDSDSVGGDEVISIIPTVVGPVLRGSVSVDVVFTGMEREKLPERSASLDGMEELVLNVGAGVELGADVIGRLEFTDGISTVTVTPVDSGTVSTRVVFVLGVSTGIVRFDEGVMKPLALVELTVRV